MIADESNSFIFTQKDVPIDLQLGFEFPLRAHYLSVIIPVYDDAHGLATTLESLRIDKENKDRFEVIVVNDGGSAGISILCKEYGVKEVQVVPNRGSYYARNRGIEQSCGEYIGFLDADVTASPTWIDEAFAAMSKWEVAGGPILVTVTHKQSVVELYQLFKLFPGQLGEYPLVLYTANMVVHRKVIETMGGFDSRLRSAGDFEFTDRVISSKKYAWGISASLPIGHPCRTYAQMVQREKRLMYGRLNLLRLYGERFDKPAYKPSPTWRLLFPYMSLFKTTQKLKMKLSRTTFIKLFLFAWWMKIRKIAVIMSVNWHVARSGKLD